MKQSMHRIQTRALGIAALFVCVTGCATTIDLAPLVDARALETADAMGFLPESVEQGRLLYITSCTKCHSPEPVTRYSLERWGGILPRMADEADLDENAEQAVSAYIKVILGVQETPG